MIDERLVTLLEDLPKENSLNALLEALDIMGRNEGCLVDMAIRISLGLIDEKDFANVDRNGIITRTSDGYIDV